MRRKKSVNPFKKVLEYHKKKEAYRLMEKVEKRQKQMLEEEEYKNILEQLKKAREKKDYKEMKKILKKMKFLYKPFYHGTSSAILLGLKETKGKLVSFGKLDEKGVTPFTGEISAIGVGGKGISKEYLSGVALYDYDVLEKYARARGFSPEKEKEVITKYEEILRENPDLSEDVKQGIKKRIELGKKRIREFERLSEKEKKILEEEFPVVIAAEPKIEPVSVHSDTHDIVTKEINLKSRKTTIFVPKDKVNWMRKELIKRGVIGAKVLPMEYLKEFEEIAREARIRPFLSELQLHPALEIRNEKKARKKAKRVMRMVKKALKKLK